MTLQYVNQKDPLKTLSVLNRLSPFCCVSFRDAVVDKGIIAWAHAAGNYRGWCISCDHRSPIKPNQPVYWLDKCPYCQTPINEDNPKEPRPMYPKDLDEYTDAQIEEEIRERKELTAKGICSYCKRTGDLHECRFHERHLEARRVLQTINERAAAIEKNGFAENVVQALNQHNLLVMSSVNRHTLKESVKIVGDIFTNYLKRQQPPGNS